MGIDFYSNAEFGRAGSTYAVDNFEEQTKAIEGCISVFVLSLVRLRAGSMISFPHCREVVGLTMGDIIWHSRYP